MKRQIRNSVFETNSSSTHSLTYKMSTYDSIEDYVHNNGKLGRITIGDFRSCEDAEEDLHATPKERINWLVGTCLNSENIENRIYALKLFEYLEDLGADIRISDDISKYDFERYYKYLEDEVFKDIFKSESSFLTFIFNPECHIETGVL